MTDKPINDGGPAFPRPGFYSEGDAQFDNEPASGMSLRDWFAGTALSGSLAPNADSAEWEAEWAYKCADAMLKQRAVDTPLGE